MAANRFGIDLGGAYRDIESIKGARTKNKLADLQLSEVERGIAERPQKEAAAQQRNQLLTNVRGKAAKGDVSAQQRLLSLDPKGGPSFIDAVSKMDANKIKQVQKSVDEMGRMAATVLNAKPEKQGILYKQMLSMLPPDSQAKMPKDFDQGFMEMSLSKALSMDKILENPKAIKMGGENVLYQRGKEIGRATIPVKEGKAGTNAASGLKSGDESLMYRQAAELLGGMFDAAGNLQALDPETRTKAQAIATEATNLFQQGGITRTQAVANAAKKYGIDMPGQVGDNDPLGIR